LSSSFEGDYEITSWTMNEEGCDAEGESTLESHSAKLALVQVCSWSMFGASEAFLEAYPCNDQADCDENRCTSNHVVYGGYMFNSGDDETGWSEDESKTFADNDGQCTGTHYHQTLTQQGDGSLKVEIKGYEVVPFPKVEECSEFMGDETCFDTCADDASTKAAEGQPCVSYEVLVLTPSNS